MDDVVKLYSTGCPRCMMLDANLKRKGIKYEVIDDESLIMKMGYSSVPLLEVNGNIMKFPEAVNWINNYEVR